MWVPKPHTPAPLILGAWLVLCTDLKMGGRGCPPAGKALPWFWRGWLGSRVLVFCRGSAWGQGCVGQRVTAGCASTSNGLGETVSLIAIFPSFPSH